jgi:hypothetical protein
MRFDRATGTKVWCEAPDVHAWHRLLWESACAAGPHAAGQQNDSGCQWHRAIGHMCAPSSQFLGPVVTLAIHAGAGEDSEPFGFPHVVSQLVSVVTSK